VKTKKAKIYAKRYTLYAIVAGGLLIWAAGCENGGKSPLAEKVDTLRLEKRQLARQIEQSKTEAEQLRKQIETLSGLGPDIRLENLYDLRQIKITKYTNLYDKDKDGQKEKLIVYIQPIDEQGDIVKASGAVDVQLWDLNKKAGQALLGQWHVKPDELKKLWFATILIINYRLTFDVADKIERFEEPLTVKVTFTDYLSGKVFKEQKVIKPR
jgi:outer membrane murein-binding lipoprotein Lpp